MSIGGLKAPGSLTTAKYIPSGAGVLKEIEIDSNDNSFQVNHLLLKGGVANQIYVSRW